MKESQQKFQNLSQQKIQKLFILHPFWSSSTALVASEHERVYNS
jgi:hypothetical protein